MLTLALVLVAVLALVVLAAWGWTRYQLAVYDAQHADARPSPRAEDRDMCC